MEREVTVYTPESEMRDFRGLVRKMIADLRGSRQLAYALLRRDVQGQYRQSVLGFFWAFVPPIVTAATFSLASQFKVLNIGVTNIPYPAYIVFSTALWQTFVEAVNAPILATNGSMMLFVQIKMPREAPLLAKIGEVYFNFAIKLLLIAAVFVIYRLPISPWAVCAPLALVCMVTFGASIGLLLAPFAALVGDVGRMVTTVMSLGMFLTPVVYPAPKAGGFFFGHRGGQSRNPPADGGTGIDSFWPHPQSARLFYRQRRGIRAADRRLVFVPPSYSLRN